MTATDEHLNRADLKTGERCPSLEMVEQPSN